MTIDAIHTGATGDIAQRKLGPRAYLACFNGIVGREVLRYLHQRERFLSALVRPLVWLFITRIGAGIAGATIPTAQAYIADCTDETTRGKGMAIIGAAFGIGFFFGPLLGSLLSEILLLLFEERSRKQFLLIYAEFAARKTTPG